MRYRLRSQDGEMVDAADDDPIQKDIAIMKQSPIQLQLLPQL